MTDEGSKITQYRVTTAMNCRALIFCLNISYVVGDERAISLSFRCILSILWVLKTFWCGYVKCNTRETIYYWLFVPVVCERCRYTSASTYCLIPLDTGKTYSYERNHGKLTVRKFVSQRVLLHQTLCLTYALQVSVWRWRIGVKFGVAGECNASTSNLTSS